MATDKLVDFDHVTDYISREAAIDAHCMNCQYINQEDDKSVCWCMEKDRLIRVPAADVRPVAKARWEDETGYIFNQLAQRVYCPVCKSYAYFYPITAKNFCPNCGADMSEARKGERDGK